MERIQSGPQREDFLAQEKLIQIELRELLIRETILWREKAKSKWFCEGDVETSFFHLSTAIHRRCNNINAILAPHDSLVLDCDNIGQIFRGYFENLFKSSDSYFPLHLNNLIFSYY